MAGYYILSNWSALKSHKGQIGQRFVGTKTARCARRGLKKLRETRSRAQKAVAKSRCRAHFVVSWRVDLREERRWWQISLPDLMSDLIKFMVQ